jgi:hypothetical protein
MLKLNAEGYSANLMWLSYYEGRLSSLHVSPDSEMMDDIVRRARLMEKALKPEAPATARQYANVANLLEAGTTVLGVVKALGRLSSTLSAEMAQRQMLIGMPGENLSDAPQSPLPQATRISGAGRPTKAWWEDAIIAVMKRIWLGDLKPKRQADVQRALEEWIDANGHEAGDTPIKERARKIFLAHEAEG